METCINYTDRTAYVSSDERKFISRILKLHETHPGDVTIIRRPESNDGCIYATIPASWVRLNPPRSVNMSEEQRHAAAERLQAARQKQVTKEAGSAVERNLPG